MSPFEQYEITISITPSEVLEYLFCPRFIYFMNCLGIPQHEEGRYKVQRGREVHQERGGVNQEYLRKKVGCVEKELSVYLSSPRNHIRGVVDEVLKLKDGSYAPLDYKFAQFKDRPFKTYRTQLVLYALLIQENYNAEVIRGFIVYTRSRNYLKEVIFSDKDFHRSVEIVEEILTIIQGGIFPRKTRDRIKCVDCCYRNICV